MKSAQVKKNSRSSNQFRGRAVEAKALSEVQTLLADSPRRRDLLIEFLHRIQDKYLQISDCHMVALASELKLSTTEVYEVASFYHHFNIARDDETAPEMIVRVCESVTCEMYGSQQLFKSLQTKYPDSSIKLEKVPCVGRCHDAPVAVIGTNAIGHANTETIIEKITAKETEIHVADYIRLDQYCDTEGYELLKACHNNDHTIENIISELKDSNLRGLGGAGFPAGMKWEILNKQSSPRIIAVNIDEGEPGTFKDRYYLERDPHRFLEGALIAAWAIKADAIYIYLRDEYAGCRKILEDEIQQLQQNPPCTLPKLHLRRGAGAYICGEESAMVESIEGKRGMPRLRPPYLAEVGLFGFPTLEHNMETLYWVRDIIEKGADWFTSHGRHGRKGLRSFSVSGRVKKPGVHLAPAGITLRELIDEYCEGMEDGHELYAYFPGGASGGILPASMSNLPMDFDTLNDTGCFIGSAAVIILSDKDRVRDAALNAMRFFEDESCGQCTPCRVGTAKASLLMEKDKWDTALLEDLSVAMIDASICGLGQAAPNPLRSVIKYFPQELSDD